MISRIKNNFSELMESLTIKKDEILKQNKIINLDNLLSFYEENKKIFLEKKEVLLNAINEYISNVDLKINLDLSFIEKFKKIIKFSKVLYVNFINIVLNYSLNYFSKKPERAPPVKFLYI